MIFSLRDLPKSFGKLAVPFPLILAESLPLRALRRF
jgi:hypothetical protein